MTEEAVEIPLSALAAEPASRRIVLDLPSWVPTERFPRWLLIGGLIVVMVAAVAGTALPFAVGWLSEDDFQTLGYPGIFLANFLGTATVFVPVPGLTAAGQTLIVLGSDSLFKPGVVVAGAAGTGPPSGGAMSSRSSAIDPQYKPRLAAGLRRTSHRRPSPPC